MGLDGAFTTGSDFLMRGLRAEQMLKALQSLREASNPGELELF